MRETTLQMRLRIIGKFAQVETLLHCGSFQGDAMFDVFPNYDDRTEAFFLLDCMPTPDRWSALRLIVDHHATRKDIPAIGVYYY